MTCPDCNVDTIANISALFVHNAHAVKCLKYVIATTAVKVLVYSWLGLGFKSECDTAQLRHSLFFLFSCYSRYCHWGRWARQYFAVVELIDLDLNDDDIFYQSEAYKLGRTNDRRHMTQNQLTGRPCSTSRRLQKYCTFAAREVNGRPNRIKDKYNPQKILWLAIILLFLEYLIHF